MLTHAHPSSLTRPLLVLLAAANLAATASCASMKKSDPGTESAPVSAATNDGSRYAVEGKKESGESGSGAGRVAASPRSGPGAHMKRSAAPADARNPYGGTTDDKGAANNALPPPSPMASAPSRQAATAAAQPLPGPNEVFGGPGGGGRGLQGGAAVAAPKPAEAPIDPNGRFATTYRPGSGHLSAFESAVSRGILPADDRELVSDVGARYAPPMAPPQGKAMALQADLERTALPPSGGPVTIRLSLRSTDKAPSERPHLSVHLVLDVSGSMGGEAIQNARAASQALVDKLAPGDDFSLVTFSSEAELKVPDGPVGPRREQIQKVIAAIHEGGGTNIGAGLMLGYKEASRPGVPRDAVRVVLLLSDGHVNSGILEKGKLAKLALDAFQDGVQTSTFGLGADYDGPLMSSIAADGAGGYYYLRDSQQIAPALATELDKRLDPVATAVEVRVRLKKGVELLHVYGSQRLNDAEALRVRVQEQAADEQAKRRDGIAKDRDDDQQGGMRFFMPAFARDDSHALLLKLKLPEGVGSRQVALIEIKYKDRVSKKNVADEVPVSIGYADSDGASAATQNASVVRTLQGFAAGEALSGAAALIDRGDREGAAALLAEREGILREAATSLGEPLFLKDADRLARLRSLTGQQTGEGDPLVLAMLLETSSRVHLR